MNRPPAPSNVRVFITGLGLVTPLGASAWSTFQALLAGRTLTDVLRPDRQPSGAGPMDPVALVQAAGCVRTSHHVAGDPSIDLAERAAREALANAGIAGDDMDAWIGTSKGAMVALTAAAAVYLPDVHPSPVRSPRQVHADALGVPVAPDLPVDVAAVVGLGPHGYLEHHLRRRLHLGRTTSVVAACASSLTALHRARQSLLNAPPSAPGQPARALVITSEAALLPMFVHSYRRLGVLPPVTLEDYRGRPLDQDRAGFIPAEQAAAIVLQRVDPGDAPPPHAVELLDTAVACEAFDLVRPADDMPALSHIAGQLLSNTQIDLLHPHATGTPENDPAELAVYRRALPADCRPEVYACKGAVGHGLGAAGLVALVLGCLAGRTGRRPPMPWLRRPLEGPFSLNNQTVTGRFARQAFFAAGFGGHTAGALIDTSATA